MLYRNCIPRKSSFPTLCSFAAGVCLEDGRQLQMLKRHLGKAFDMSPEQYRRRWGLPVDYPMVAPNYAKKRSQLAKNAGLGTRGRAKA